MNSLIEKLKVQLRKEVERQHVSYKELAERMEGITGYHYAPMQISRLLSLEHASKIDTLDVAFQALGKRIDVKVQKLH